MISISKALNPFIIKIYNININMKWSMSEKFVKWKIYWNV